MDQDNVVTLAPTRPPSTDPPTFTRTADATLTRARATYDQRGNAYGDTWALPNLHTELTEYVLNLRRDVDYRAWLRLLMLAALCDVKDSRIPGGGNIDDHLIDGINYRASLTEHLREYEGR